MFFSQIASYTKAHLMSHLPVLLAEETAKYTDSHRIIYPKSIDISSMIGGVLAISHETLPQYSIDCNLKSLLNDGVDNLNEYLYEGQMVYLVGGSNMDAIQEVNKRHAAVLEQFCRTHQFLHQYSDDVGFMITGFGFDGTELMGPMELATETKGTLWVAGGTIDVSWKASEVGYFQHGP